MVIRESWCKKSGNMFEIHPSAAGNVIQQPAMGLRPPVAPGAL
jgi:hypothetical protein